MSFAISFVDINSSSVNYQRDQLRRARSALFDDAGDMTVVGVRARLSLQICSLELLSSLLGRLGSATVHSALVEAAREMDKRQQNKAATSSLNDENIIELVLAARSVWAAGGGGGGGEIGGNEGVNAAPFSSSPCCSNGSSSNGSSAHSSSVAVESHAKPNADGSAATAERCVTAGNGTHAAALAATPQSPPVDATPAAATTTPTPAPAAPSPAPPVPANTAGSRYTMRARSAPRGSRRRGGAGTGEPAASSWMRRNATPVRAADRRRLMEAWSDPPVTMAEAVSGFSSTYRRAVLDVPQMSCRRNSTPFDALAMERRRRAWAFGNRSSEQLRERGGGRSGGSGGSGSGGARKQPREAQRGEGGTRAKRSLV